MKGFPTYAREWGPLGVSLFALAVALVAILLVTVGLPAAGVDTTPTASDAPIVPASGVPGYSTAHTLAFCRDTDTKVAASPAPEVGVVYSLTRDKSGVVESVIITANDQGIGTHYYETAVGQQSETAAVDGAVRKCIEDKLR